MVFEKLSEIIELKVEYTTKGSLAIQTGGSPAFSAMERPVIMMGGEPVIPGSSLKGSLRSLLEATLSNEGVRVCLPEAAIPQEEMRRDRKEDYARRIGREVPCDPGKGKVCPICEIFGAASLSGRAIFLDARPVGEVALIERNHVAITRDTKAAAPGKLMQVQAVDAGAVFQGVIRLINPERWHVGALMQALDNLSFLGLGSKKTAGYGEIETKVVEVIRREMRDGSLQVKAIDDPSAFVEDFRFFLTKARQR